MNTALTISIVLKFVKLTSFLNPFQKVEGDGGTHVPSFVHVITFPPPHPSSLHHSHSHALPPPITPTSLSPPLSDGSEDSLKALIHARQQSRGAQMDNFFDSLEQKYAKKQKSSFKAGGSKNKASGSKGTRKGKKTQCMTSWLLCLCLVMPPSCVYTSDSAYRIARKFR